MYAPEVRRLLHIEFNQLSDEALDEHMRLMDDEEDNPACSPQNEAKNRYSNSIPIQSTLVKLNPASTPHHSSYINASHIHLGTTHFIATQAPQHNTLSDFWQMVWEQRVGVIIMLTKTTEHTKDYRGHLREHRKAEPYWPVEDAPIVLPFKQDGDPATLTIEHTGWKRRLHAMLIRSVRVSIQGPKPSPPLDLSIISYAQWPDLGVPSSFYTFLEFLALAHRTHSKAEGPVLVHCSAGIGRTGTFLACWRLWRMLTAEIDAVRSRALLVPIDGERIRAGHSLPLEPLALPHLIVSRSLSLLPADVVREVRRQRHPEMVQTEEQYVFIHCFLDMNFCMLAHRPGRKKEGRRSRSVDLPGM
eukprot:gnl/Dysnectes_brevis/2146_a2496_1861.p1 GENE.gnl/Dysnectes_brevis/2146_a2496_1861~~gnl/Dysnectes_brevis/2146_a2496_1861.p1  ORF type:complete len:359 (-),score=81.13 gnl/Dysnectes_brevis/2146_a2496_1861:649-1725(-)